MELGELNMHQLHCLKQGITPAVAYLDVLSSRPQAFNTPPTRVQQLSLVIQGLISVSVFARRSLFRGSVLADRGPCRIYIVAVRGTFRVSVLVHWGPFGVSVCHGRSTFCVSVLVNRGRVDVSVPAGQGSRYFVVRPIRVSVT